MTLRSRSIGLALALAMILGVASRPAQADLTQAAMALATPLAQQFGVDASKVTGLLQQGVSVESVTQLLLVSQSADTGLGKVAKLYEASGSQIDETASQLNVDPSAYAKSKVDAAIASARQKATASAAEGAAAGAAEAADSAKGAMDSMMGGFAK